MKIQTVAVVGAGTMGAGIAQVCAAAGFNVLLYDLNPEWVQRALAGIEKNLVQAVEKGKLDEAAKNQTLGRIAAAQSLESVQADLIIEAIVEKLEPKQKLFQQLEQINAGAILASNTSTFPITSIAQNLKQPALCIGLHFFNPAHIMKLVEIISGDHTAPQCVEAMQAFCKQIDKVAVLAKDSPGFIVNRVARPYYVESLKVLEEEGAPMENIDRLLRASGFKMGPFELMDLIGVDTNLAVTTSLYEAFDKAPRFKPSPIQQSSVANGHWGRKTGKGFYDYQKK
ncbi:MAG: 3-hydroxyacyl-CoA dehydrogenase family protein [Bacteroidota bacterium]